MQPAADTDDFFSSIPYTELFSKIQSQLCRADSLNIINKDILKNPARAFDKCNPMKIS